MIHVDGGAFSFYSPLLFYQSKHALRQPMWLVWLQIPIGNLHNRLLQKEARDTSEAKQTRGKTWSSRVPAGNTCSGHSSGPVLWCMQDVSKHVRLQREHLNKHDQTYTWFEIDLTAKTIRCGKNIDIFLPHTSFL